jgi:hypothetical protein
MAKYAQEPVELSKFAGLRNNTPAENFSPEDLQVAINADIDNDQGIMRRAGYTERVAGNHHSLWSKDDVALVAIGATLKRLRATSATAYALDTLRSDLTTGARLSYWMVNGQVYYTNGHQSGVITQGVNRTFGLTPPIGQPIATAIGGGLPAGRYQYALTYLRNDGQESGTGLAGTIDLTGQAGIGFSSIPVSGDPTVAEKAVYLTATNGEVMYRAMTIANTDTTASYRNTGYDLRLPLNTQFGQPAPVGNLVAWYRGRMLVAQGPALWYSVPYRYELFMLGKAFLPFEADINLLAPVEDGVFVGADQTYFMSGQSPETFGRRIVAGYGATPGTLAYEQGDYLGDGVAGRVAYWASPRGHCVGTNGGSFKNITEARYSYPTAPRGAGIVRQVNGINQYLAILEGTGIANNAFV